MHKLQNRHCSKSKQRQIFFGSTNRTWSNPLRRPRRQPIQVSTYLRHNIQELFHHQLFVLKIHRSHRYQRRISKRLNQRSHILPSRVAAISRLQLRPTSSRNQIRCRHHLRRRRTHSIRTSMQLQNSPSSTRTSRAKRARRTSMANNSQDLILHILSCKSRPRIFSRIYDLCSTHLQCLAHQRTVPSFIRRREQKQH